MSDLFEKDASMVEDLDAPVSNESKWIHTWPKFSAPQSPASPRAPQSPPAPHAFHVPSSQAPPGPLPPHGETILQRPISAMEMLSQWQEWDKNQQQILRQQCASNSDCHRAVFTPQSQFTPIVAPVLAPIVDPDFLQASIDKIAAKFKGVHFMKEDVAFRKSFLMTVDSKISNLMARTMRKCHQYSRQKQEYESLREYDAEISRLRDDIELATALIGGCVGNRTGELDGGGRESRKDAKKRKRAPMEVDDEMIGDNSSA